MMKGVFEVREAAWEQLSSIATIKGKKFGNFVLAMIILHQATLAFTNVARASGERLMTEEERDEAARVFIHCLEQFTILYADAADISSADIEDGLEWASTIFHGAIERLETMAKGGMND